MTTQTVPYTPDQVLDRFSEIIRNEQLLRGSYFDAQIVEGLEDAVCGGHQACAVGALVIAAGHRIGQSGTVMEKLTEEQFRRSLNGHWPNNRDEFMVRHELTGKVYDALNQAAVDYTAEHMPDREHAAATISYGALEWLFEHGMYDLQDKLYDDSGIARDMPELTTEVMLDVTERARVILKAA